MPWNVYEMFKGRLLDQFGSEADALTFGQWKADSIPDDAGIAVVGGPKAKLPKELDDLDELGEGLVLHRIHPATVSVATSPETMVAPQNMATAAATKTKSKPVIEKKIGRPKSGFAERYYLRHHQEQIEAWRVAAATTGKSLHQWMLESLDGEAKKATHVPMVKRGR